GTIEELRSILQSLEIHGVAVDRIVVATPADRLEPRSLTSLFELEKSSNIIVQFLSERLGFDGSQNPSVPAERKRNAVPGQRAVARVGGLIDAGPANSLASFQRGKRIVDVIGATFLIFILSPLVLLVSLMVAIDVGFPVLFWQQRPGLYGRP